MIPLPLQFFSAYRANIFLYSVIKNIAHLCSRTRSKIWGPDGWQKVVVCVVSDGRNKVNKRTLQVLTLVIAADYLGKCDVVLIASFFSSLSSLSVWIG